MILLTSLTLFDFFLLSLSLGENMVYKCGKEVTPHIPAITKLCLAYICYDPNYNYDDAEDEEGMDCDGDDVRIYFDPNERREPF